jgi:CMP-N,N'-diacetyllegionaminic acid synthase
MSVVAIVPARSGSKRLPGKNIKELGGLPLVCWTLKACLESKSIDKVIFSTDSMEYWEIAKRVFPDNEKLVLSLRTESEAGDKVKIFDYIKENADYLFSEEDVMVLTLPTMPFRSASDIDRAFDIFTQESKAVFSASEYDFHVSFAFNLDESGSWLPLNHNSPMLTGNTRSQDQKAAYHPNGAIYIREVKDFENDDLKTFYQGAHPYIMNKITSVDIDEESDFLLAECIVLSGLTK